MRGWHHQLTHLNIHKDWSRNVFWKNVKFQNVTTSLFLIRFSSFLHQSVTKFLLFLLKRGYGNSGLDFPFKDCNFWVRLYAANQRPNRQCSYRILNQDRMILSKGETGYVLKAQILGFHLWCFKSPHVKIWGVFCVSGNKLRHAWCSLMSCKPSQNEMPWF